MHFTENFLHFFGHFPIAFYTTTLSNLYKRMVKRYKNIKINNK